MLESLALTVGQALSQRSVIEWLVANGYGATPATQFSGEFAARGEIVDLWPVNRERPVRLEWFGDTVERIRSLADRSQLDHLAIKTNVLEREGVSITNGDFIVHLNYGVGKFLALRQAQGKIEIVCEYSRGDRLYVPWERRELIFPYQGVGRRPILASLSHRRRWEATKKRVLESIYHLAKDLLAVAAARAVSERPPYTIPTEWLDLIDRGVSFRMTESQLRATDDILSDLQQHKPMDRLLLGDVGFGKTEVALRAMVAAVANGRQVALLAPTTVLCDQHGVVIGARLGQLPIRLAVLNRFTPPPAKRKILTEMLGGTIDLLIGTQSLLADQLKFKNLGLLIIDEEQRFGVRQKELLKERRVEVDVLSLSATPIPRTLFMTLGGLRDLSLISDPPAGRRNVETAVHRFDWLVVIAALRREKARGGQSYLVHNRVETLGAVAEYLKRQAPDLTVTIAHGQLPEHELVDRMHAFTEGQADVLLCSTIIQSGLDLPNVNTLIVDRAERFGLPDLYQLRGRVGRSDRQAYAHFLLGDPVSGFTSEVKDSYTSEVKHLKLTIAAKARLEAIASIEELGRGFEIASKDLEIRGGGNLLGREQSGNMHELGLVLYSKLLKLGVERIKVGAPMVIEAPLESTS